MKVIHNFCQCFKKDSGAHFTYNVGVTFIRLSAIVMLIALAALIYSILKPGVKLDFCEKVNVSVDGLRSENRRSGGYKSSEYIYTVYIVDFHGSYASGGEFDYSQEISKDMYKYYTEIQHMDSFSANLYLSSDGLHYISPRDKSDARKEYIDTYMDMRSNLSQMAAFVLFLVSLTLAAIGGRQIRLSMKYPRNDVPLEDLKPDENQALLEEFDRLTKNRRKNRFDNKYN